MDRRQINEEIVLQSSYVCFGWSNNLTTAVVYKQTGTMEYWRNKGGRLMVKIQREAIVCVKPESFSVFHSNRIARSRYVNIRNVTKKINQYITNIILLRYSLDAIGGCSAANKIYFLEHDK
jgi:hypothetical protein